MTDGIAIHRGVEATANRNDVRVVAAAVDVLPCDREGHTLGNRAVRAPEFIAVGAVVGLEVEVVPEGSEVARIGAIGATVARVDVFDQGGRGAVGAPEFKAMRAVGGSEVEVVLKSEE
jgi:hypothetical protein